MIYSSDLSLLIGEWLERHNRSDNFDYKVAISECIQDLQALILKNVNNEIDNTEKLWKKIS